MAGYNLVMLIFSIFLLQSSLLPFLFNGVFQPDLCLVMVTLSAIMLDRRSVLIFAFAEGFLQDIIIGNMFGLHLLPYLLIALFLLHFGRKRYNRHWYVSVVAVLIATIVYFIISGLLMRLSGIHSFSIYLYLYTILVTAAMNGCCALIFHNMMRIFKKEEESLW